MFIVRYGEIIGIIGFIGSGKLMFVKFIFCLYDFDDGEIFVDGKNFMDYDVKVFCLFIGFIF